MLDNPMLSVRVAYSREEHTSQSKIVPNPFGGVNTHLWRNETYLVGIVPVVRLAYSPQERIGKGTGGKGLLVGFSVSRQNMACYPNRKF